MANAIEKNLIRAHMLLRQTRGEAGEEHDQRSGVWDAGRRAASAPAKSEYKGKTYDFCSPACKTVFEKHPEKCASK